MIVSDRLASTLKVLATVLIVLLVLFLGTGGYLYGLSQTLPDISTDPHALNTSQTSVVYAADGTALAQWHGEENRTIIEYEDIPEDLRDAVVAIEDERFYEHNGVDTQAIFRALRTNAEEGSVAQGGSTITQQLVKILFTDGERSLTRKIREALLAYQLEAKTSKQDVLKTYLNTVYFGHGAYGVESAAQTYFGVSASDVSLSQSAMLAAVLNSPGRYSPIDAPEAAVERRNLVLTKMAEHGYITGAEQLAARDTELTLAPRENVPEIAPYFVEYVKQELIDVLGADAVFKGGLRIYTTLNPALQARAESVVRSQLGGEGDPEVALVAVTHDTGEVAAMIGGRDFKTNQFNLAVQGRRQPGSAFKPFVLVRALEEGVRPDQVFSAAPYSVEVKDGTWNVSNYENQAFESQISLRAATNWSVNCVYARLIMQVGPEDVVDVAHRMGIETALEPNPAIALGGLTTGVSPLEMASAYGTIGAGGTHVAPSGIARVTNDNGDVLYEPDRTPSRAIDKSVALEASLMLHDVVESGTGTASKIPNVWSAGKTGTTQSYRDAWFTGYAEDLSCAVWVGYREGQIEMDNVHGVKVTGGSFPASIWREFMKAAIAHQRAPLTPNNAGLPGGDQAEPVQPQTSGVVVSVCPDSMLLANKRCPAAIEMLLDPALAPAQTCTKH